MRFLRWYKSPYILIIMVLLTCLFIQVSISPGPSQRALAAPNVTKVSLGGKRIYQASPVAADLNQDGRKEILVGAYDGMVYVISYISNNWTTVWQRQTASDLNTVLPASEQQPIGRIDAPISVGDIDKDGALEIVVATGGTPSPVEPIDNRNGGLIVYELVASSGNNWSFSVKPGWPFLMPDTMGAGNGARQPDGVRDGIPNAPTLGDIDGDGDLEIISMAFDRRIYAFHHNGTDVAGWPIARENGDIILRGGWSSAAIGDIDDDGLNEVVIGTGSPPWNGDDGSGPFPPIYDIPDYTLATVWALNGDSSLVPGWPVITEQYIQSSPALGDIDGDGDLEIVVGTGDFPDYVNGRQVYAWHGDGSPVNNWPKDTADFMRSSPALADLDGNGVLDVIIGCGHVAPPTCKILYAWDGNGNDLPGFPLATPFTYPYPPVIADIDGDGQLEILLTSLASASISVVQHNGSLGSIDFSRGTNKIILSSPLADDIDGDGFLETVVGGAGLANEAAVFIFDEVTTTSVTPFSLPWPMFQHDAAYSGNSQPPEFEFTDQVRFFHQQGNGSVAYLTKQISNKSSVPMQWQIDTSGTAGKVNVDKSSGTLAAGSSSQLTFSVNTTGFTTNQWHHLGTITASATTTGGLTPKTVSSWLLSGDIHTLFLPTIKR